MKSISEYRNEREHWSNSSLGSFMRCSLQYFFKYLSDTSPEFTPANLVFGNALHRSFEHLARSRMVGTPASVVEVQECFADVWADLSKDRSIRFSEGERVESANKGLEMVACLHDNWNEKEEVVGISKAYCTPILDAAGDIVSERPLLSEIDLIVKSDGKEILVDWKSSKSRWSTGKADSEIQPTAYLYSHNMGGGTTSMFRFDVITKAKTPVYQKCETTRTIDDMHRLAELVRSVEHAVNAEAFFPNHQNLFGCGGCQYRSACKAWHRDRAKTISQPALSLTA